MCEMESVIQFSRYAVIFVTSNVFIIACASGISGGNEKTPQVVTEADADREVSLATGEPLSVRLAAQLGTGYGWQIARSDAALLKSLGPPDTEPPKGGQLGGAQYQVFRFVALSPGLATLEFRYVRPWEQAVTPARTFRIDVRIR